MKNRTLVTSALEATWPNDKEPVLFLGEWCKLYSNKNVWEKLDYKVVPFQWDDRTKLHKDYLDILNLYEDILASLSNKLNSLHQVNFSLRYWRILVGPWLFGFITVLYDRWSGVEKALSEFNVLKTIVLEFSDSESIPQSMEHYLALSKSDEWNHFICSCIIKESEFRKNLNIENVKVSNRTLPRPPKRENNRTAKISRLISRLSTFLSKNNDRFIIGSSLKRFDLFKLQLKLFQFPAIYSIPVYSETINPIMADRQWKLKKSNINSDFEKLLIKLIPLQIPVVYLEGYEKISDYSHNIGWPKNPKLIWTSNAFYDVEIFKVWAANKVEKGVPLLIGQHGGHYGIGLFDLLENHELKICDYYLSWGSSLENKKTIPIGIFKNYRKRVGKDFAILIIASTSRYVSSISSMPISSQMLPVLENQLTFLNSLPEYILNDFIIRTYPHDYGWSQYDRFKDKFPKLKIDNCSEKIENSWLNCKLSISMWNSTTMLESLSLDIPTIIYWDPKFFELKKSAIPYFNELKEVGIFHENPESAAEFITEIWTDIDGWWDHPKVVNAKNVFIEKYANKSALLSKLKMALK